MSHEPKRSAINLNTIISLIVLGTIAWAGKTIQTVSSKIDIIEVRQADDSRLNSERDSACMEKINALSVKVDRQGTLIGEIQIDIAKLQRRPPPPPMPQKQGQL